MKGLFDLLIWRVAWPVCFGYLPLGIACGIFAQKAELDIAQTIGLCLIVYAGSGQFIGIAMMALSASAVSIALTIFIVNLRHFLFSSTLAKFLKQKSRPFLALYAYEITDESFAVNLNAFEHSDWTANDAIKVNHISHLTWTISNIIGFVGAGLISIDTRLVGYTLTAMFIGLWVSYLSQRKMILAGVLSGILAVVLAMFVGYKMHIVLAAIIVSSLFCFLTIKEEQSDSCADIQEIK